MNVNEVKKLLKTISSGEHLPKETYRRAATVTIDTIEHLEQENEKLRRDRENLRMFIRKQINEAEGILR